MIGYRCWSHHWSQKYHKSALAYQYIYIYICIYIYIIYISIRFNTKHLFDSFCRYDFLSTNWPWEGDDFSVVPGGCNITSYRFIEKKYCKTHCTKPHLKTEACTFWVEYTGIRTIYWPKRIKKICYVLICVYIYIIIYVLYVFSQTLGYWCRVSVGFILSIGG